MDWFKHDMHCTDDSKLKQLMRKFHALGYAVFFCAIESLYMNNGEPMDIAELALDIQEKLRGEKTERIKDVLLFAIDLELFAMKEDKLYSKRTADNCEEVNGIKEKKSKAGKKGMAVRWKDDNSLVTNEYQTDNKCYKGVITNEYQTDNTSITEKEIDKDKREEKEIDKEKEDSLSASADYTLTSGDSAQEPLEIPYGMIQQSYNQSCPSLPRCTVISDKRRKSIRACWVRYGDRMLEAFRLAEESDFLTGRDGRGGSFGFDWLMNSNNMLKVLEGNYKNGAKQKPARQRKYDPTSMDNWEGIEGGEITL